MCRRRVSSMNIRTGLSVYWVHHLTKRTHRECPKERKYVCALLNIDMCTAAIHIGHMSCIHVYIWPEFSYREIVRTLLHLPKSHHVQFIWTAIAPRVELVIKCSRRSPSIYLAHTRLCFFPLRFRPFCECDAFGHDLLGRAGVHVCAIYM